MPRRPAIGVIGGSGLYALLDEAHELVVDTPYGRPSDPLTVGEVAGRAVAFLPRHGRDHRHPPHRIPYRANLWALRAVGVRQLLAPSAVGSLDPDLGPGALVVPDQVVDRTSGRTGTYYDGDTGPVHVAFADPYCPAGRRTVLRTAAEVGWPTGDGGTLVVVPGPRFSSRAESRFFARQGWTVVGMTGLPEAALARELALCYTPICLVTDYDAGVVRGGGVTQQDVFRVFAENVERLRQLVLAAAPRLPHRRSCPCGRALTGLTLPFRLP